MNFQSRLLEQVVVVEGSSSVLISKSAYLLRSNAPVSYTHLQMDLGVPLGSLEVSTEEINNSDFENEWKKYFKPTRVSDFITIKPTWEEYNPAEPDEIVIEMDPGMAFGTGTHETTKMCIKLLEEFLEENAQLWLKRRRFMYAATADKTLPNG